MVRYTVAVFATLMLAVCARGQSAAPVAHPDAQAAFDYLKTLDGNWVVDGGDEGSFGWEFDVTSRGTVVTERLKVGATTEMTTVYHLDGNALVAAHYCQLGNQPRLIAVESHTNDAGDLHFVCDGSVGSAESHAELHMHGVHFRRTGDIVSIWMDMTKDGKISFQTS